MTIFNIKNNLVMTRHLVEKGSFKHHPFCLVDVGAAAGYHVLWDIFGADLNVLGFEPRKSECDALNVNNPHNVTYVPYALSDDNGLRDFYVTKHPYSSSFCSGETDFMRRFPDKTNLETVEKLVFETRRLDDVLKEHGVSHVDFIKIDVDGAEFDVLSGAGETLRDFSTLGVVTEFCIHPEMRKGCSTFSRIDQFLVSAGFHPYDIDVYRYSRNVLQHPSRFIHSERNDNQLPGPTPRGQVLAGDALYLKDYVGGDFNHTKLDVYQVLKLACLYEIYGLSDCAAELILCWKDQLNEITDTRILLDLLTEEWTGTKVSYNEYVKNGPVGKTPLLKRAVPDIERLLQVIDEYHGRFGPVLGVTCRGVGRRIIQKLRLT